MIIYWRVCEKQETLSFVPRWKNKDKLEIIKKCWISLQNSVDKTDEIIVVEDGCSKETQDFLESTKKVDNFAFHHVKPHPELDNELIKGKSGHFEELAALVDEKTKVRPEEVHFICNDDFLFLPAAVPVMKDIFQEGWPGFVVPYDYPDRYTTDQTRLAEVYLGRFCHWRTIPSCTSITSAKGKVWQMYMRSFRRNAHFNDDSWTWEAYSFAKSKAICPIPGLATHLTEGCMTPLIDWEGLWNNINVQTETE